MEFRFGLVGCGRIAERHAQLLTSGQINHSVLSAVCDTDIERGKAFAQKHNAPFYPSISALAESGLVDVFVVLTPSGEHARNVIELSEYQKPIIVEKPMALALDDARQMISACETWGSKLFVVKQNRFNRPIVKTREALEQGRFGRFNMGTVRVRWCRDQNYYDQDSWRGRWESDGGVFANQASHHVDLLQWMLGDVVSVFARGKTFLADIEAEDTGVALLKFKSGALGVIEATTSIRPTDLEGSLSLLGELGSVEVGGFAANKLLHWNFSDMGDEDTILTDFDENPPDVYGFGHKTYLNNVVECLKKGDDAMVSGEEGLKSLEIIVAIYESIASGREIHFPFVPQHCRLGVRSSGVDTVKDRSFDSTSDRP